jgi:hypothetical protein
VKKLFFVLLVLNLVLWLWGKRQELAPGLVPVDPGGGVIRLLDESEIAARREQAVAAAVERAASVVTPSAVTEPVSPPTEPSGDADMRQVVADATQVATAGDALPVPDASDIGRAQAAAPIAADPLPAVPLAPSADGGAEAAAAPVETTSEAALAVADGAPPIETPANASTRPLDAEPPAESNESASAPYPDAKPPTGSDVPDAPVAAEAPATPAPTEPAVAASARAEAGESADTSAPTTTAVTPMPATMICESFGPFRDRAAAERHASSLRSPVEGVVVREEITTKPVRYWVLAPVVQGGDAVYRQALAAAGIQDAWRVNSGPFAGRLSLGAFLVEDNARKQVAMLAAQGIASELQTVKEQERRWWIDYERPEGVPASARTLGTARVVERRCARVAAP